jgi:glyoxylase-like metal-dependent hydrolase (beta-lactamase superfamily II)/ferredoxin
MALLADRLPENAAGDLFVDSTCIDCDTCRQIAPAVYERSARGLSFVVRQPVSAADEHRALMALVSCPTHSIGSVSHADTSAAVQAFPEPVDGSVYYCGFTSERSFGASSYLIVRPEGNVLVDSPRATEPLFRRVEELGGVRFLFLTHADDVADHARWQKRFGAVRLLHEADVDAGTREVERRLSGHAPIRLAGDLVAIPVPGHTAGSTALLFENRFLFTGDHLWWSEAYGRLHASRGVCWYSWPEQLESVRRLLEHRFEWLLPGHGRRFHAGSAEAMRAQIEICLQTLNPHD